MIVYEERKSIYQKAFDRYGVDLQKMVAMEEMAELTKELVKFARGEDSRAQIIEEIADVTIMLEQLRLIFGCNDEVQDVIDKKLTRLELRICADGFCDEVDKIRSKRSCGAQKRATNY